MAKLIEYYRLRTSHYSIIIKTILIITINVLLFQIINARRIVFAFEDFINVFVTIAISFMLILYVMSLLEKNRLFKSYFNYDPVKHSNILYNILMVVTILAIVITSFSTFLNRVLYSGDAFYCLKVGINESVYITVILILAYWIITIYFSSQKIFKFIPHIILVITSLFIIPNNTRFVLYLLIIPMIIETKKILNEEG